MFSIIYYNKNDQTTAETEDFIVEKRQSTSKADRNLGNTIYRYLIYLEEFGTNIGNPIVKHLDEGIWELRPSKYRIFFFYWKDNTFVLLNYYLKKSQKTPPSELERAKRYRRDWLNRKGEKK